VSTVALVAGLPLDESCVDDREAAIRSGRAGAVLPAPASSEGRQFRRWLVQVLVAERLVAAFPAVGAPSLRDVAADQAALLELGSVAAALLTTSAEARSAFRSVTSSISVSDAEVAAYHQANPELFTRAEGRRVRHARLAAPEDAPQWTERVLRRGELVGPVQDAVFAAEVGTTVGPVRDPLGWHLVEVLAVVPGGVAPLAEVGERIRSRLLGPARRRAFATWLDRQRAEHVRLAEGFEHPGDPAQPDNTHRH
jgi:[acyl-carrier-protein] S-malonyltransferase